MGSSFWTRTIDMLIWAHILYKLLIKRLERSSDLLQMAATLHFKFRILCTYSTPRNHEKSIRIKKIIMEKQI